MNDKNYVVRNFTGLVGVDKTCCTMDSTAAPPPEECTKRRKNCFTELSYFWKADGNLSFQ